MLRGEIRLVNLDPVVGAEAARRRPAVVVSTDRANTVATRLRRGVVTVVPLTTDVERIYPFQVLLPSDVTGLPENSKAQAEQIRSVAVERLGRQIGTVPAGLMAQLDDALRLHLSL